MRPPIYTPSGPALEYASHGLNIYESCPHGCTYCYAAAMAKRFGKPWGEQVSVRPGLLEALSRQLPQKEWWNAGRLVHLCFTCDPYPVGHDSSATREVIKEIKESGNHVQILTKGDGTAQRDFDLLDGNDSFGITLSGGWKEEPGAAWDFDRIDNLIKAKAAGIKTWVSCEPVINPQFIVETIGWLASADLWRIGKMNHQKSNIDWKQFRYQAEAMCRTEGRKYEIKKDLLKATEA